MQSCNLLLQQCLAEKSNANLLDSASVIAENVIKKMWGYIFKKVINHSIVLEVHSYCII